MNTKEPVLVIMAAGMGSRFGGLKQITPVDPQRHSIIDFSLYDARRAGFSKVVFIIKHAIEEDFKAAVGRRMEQYFDVRYVYQELSCLPEGFTVPEGREKPWGTAHAIACARDAIDGPFAVLNADDYYGAGAIQAIYDFLKEEHAPNEHAMVAYQLRKTVSENGYVSRGECAVEDGYLVSVTERVRIEKRGMDAARTEDGGKTWVAMPGDTPVSMNLWGFQYELLEEFTGRFAGFLQKNLAENPLKCEYYLPMVVNAQLEEKRGTIRVLNTDEVWYGMTYQADVFSVQNAIAAMKKNGRYPEHLWLQPAAAFHFHYDGAPFTIAPCGNGHINRTYIVTTTTGKRYILQRISDAFDIDILMGNAMAVTEYAAAQTDDPRSVVHFIYTTDGKNYYRAPDGNYRSYEYVEGTVCLEEAGSPEDFYESALAFGRFMELLSAFPVETIGESIPNFHNTPDRYRIFHEKLEEDPCGRVSEVPEEIAFALKYEAEGGILQAMRDSGKLPVRVTHNDTKLNNVLFDEQTHKALCIIDLDTVMPGLSAYDYGDAIRFGAVTAAEDETDLDRMKLDMNLFRLFTRGFLEACSLTETEIEMLPMGAKIMTLENGVRFLTDYLDGDHYFSIHREKHNLDRARTQFRIVTEMEAHWDELCSIIREEAKAIGRL